MPRPKIDEGSDEEREEQPDWIEGDLYRNDVEVE
jgi:hypothetical protein